jgi:hypothetical protein
LASSGGVTGQGGGGGGGAFSRYNTLAVPAISADGREVPASKVVSELEQGLKPGIVAGGVAADAGMTLSVPLQNVNGPAAVLSAIPAPVPALVAGTSANANSQIGLRQNFSLAAPSPAPIEADFKSGSTNSFIGRVALIAEPIVTESGSLPIEAPPLRIDPLDVQSKTEAFGLQDENVSHGVSPNSTAMLEGARKLREENLKISKETLNAATDGLAVDRRAQDLNFIHANKDETPGPVINAQSSASAFSDHNNDGYLDLFATAQSPAPALPVDSLLRLTETPALSINELVLKTQLAAPPGGTSNSLLEERSKAENSK